MTGEQDPGCRKCMIWDKEDQDEDMFAFVKKLTHLRKERATFGNHGDIRFIQASSETNHVMYEKTSDEETILFIVNNSPHELVVTLPDGTQGKVLHDIWNDEEFAADADVLQAKLPAYGFQILSYK
jgi:glycosidase